MKRLKINEKEAGVGPFFKRKSISVITRCNSYSVETQKGGEIWRLQVVNDLHEFCAVASVACREDATWEEAELEECCDRLVLGHLRRSGKEPSVLFDS